jgi:putative intracellular protease/amidase
MKVLIVLYPGFTEYEYQIPVLAFHHFDISFESVGLEGAEVTGMMGLKISLGRTLAEVDPGDYQALLLPGVDRSTREQAMQNQGLMALIREYDQARKLITAVCAGPALLGSAGVLKGRRFCSDIQEHPVFEGAIRVAEPVVRDGHLITGLGSRIFHVTALLVEDLLGKEKAGQYRQWAGI